MNQYNVVKSQQIALDADSPEDAVKRALNGEGTSPGISINVQLRPKPTPTPIVGAIGAPRPNG